jgi:predicted phosphodiesterase
MRRIGIERREFLKLGTAAATGLFPPLALLGGACGRNREQEALPLDARKVGSVLRLAALYDIHANLPALEAVLEEVREAEVEHVLVGGDVVPGPMPRETLARLLDLDLPVQFVHGNGELAVLAQVGARDSSAVAYWGTTSGNPLPEPLREVVHWTAQQIHPEYESVLARWPKTLTLEIRGLGDVLFCHGTPESETEAFTRLTPEDVLLRVFDEVSAPLVVCGHTHMQFDRMVGKTRVVNAGSVGMPFGQPGANWALLGPDVQLRRTAYDLRRAADRVRETEYPQAHEFAQQVLQPPSEEEMLELFTHASFR